MVKYMRILEVFRIDFIHKHKQMHFVLPLQSGDANQNGEAVKGRFYLSSAPFRSNRLTVHSTMPSINILIEDYCDY
ncbi:hypothetical protein BT93_D2195 [Corymbia citriodora subsp. variegata]|nr:hypothetical protein BT93_D2195 [Corymbia citriodora subsp. variegata]